MRQLLSVSLAVVMTPCMQAQQVPPASAAAPVAAQQATTAPSSVSAPNTASTKLVLEDATPVKLRLSRNVSSADSKTGDTVDFEVLEEVRVGDVLVIPKGGIAWGTVTDAEHKKRLARGGKLDMTIDYVRLVDGERTALRGVKETSGGGHTGAMTAGIVATGLIVWPAAPFFLFMHGKDITIPKGTEITAYTNGNTPLDSVKFTPQVPSNGGVQGAAATAPLASSQATLDISSTPPGADIELDGSFVGNTPSTLGVSPGDHTVKLTRSGYAIWERKLKTSTGVVKLAPELESVTPVAAK